MFARLTHTSKDIRSLLDDVNDLALSFFFFVAAVQLENKAHRCKEDKLKANDTYHSLVNELESVREKWEKETEKACEVFEQVEHERIIFFRNELWVHLNIESKTLYDQDEVRLRMHTM